MVADSLTGAERARLGVIAETPPEPTRLEREAKRSALVERDGHLDWKGEPCAPCTYCGSIFVASALRAMNGAALACKRCNGERAGNG